MRTYQVKLELTEYRLVTVNTEDGATNEEIRAAAMEEAGITPETCARAIFTRDVTPVPRTVKERVKTAFQKLRKVGVVARMNYTCCSSCGWAQLESDYPKFNDDTDTAVFYHNQDNDALDKQGNLATYREWENDEIVHVPRKLYLAWTGDGDLIKGALQSEGLTVEWDGSPTRRIAVTGVREGSM